MLLRLFFFFHIFYVVSFWNEYTEWDVRLSPQMEWIVCFCFGALHFH